MIRTRFKGLLFATAIALTSPAVAEKFVIETIPRDELLSFLSEGEAFELIDARSAAEYEAGHIHGAVNIPHDAELSSNANLPADLDRAIVVYCRSGQRAFQLSQKLKARGYRNVRILAPTQMFWSDGLPVFNCGVEKPQPFTLQVAESNELLTGEEP